MLSKSPAQLFAVPARIIGDYGNTKQKIDFLLRHTKKPDFL
jgi:hypothetical protein